MISLHNENIGLDDTEIVTSTSEKSTLPQEAKIETSSDLETYTSMSETALRPQLLDEYVGQTKAKENLRIFIQAAKQRSGTLDHVLFFGPPGLGKTTLANIIGHEMGVGIKSTSGPVIEKPGDLAAILTNLNEGDVLFIDEIHRLSPIVEEILYPAMEDFQIDILIGQGPSARTVKLEIPKFTLVGATTRAGLLSAPLRDRFGILSRLNYYTADELCKIIQRSALLLDIEITPESASEIARRSRGTPRISNRLLRRVRDFAQVSNSAVLDFQTSSKALTCLEVDNLGLDQMDRAILRTIIETFNGGPVGLDTLSAAVGEEKETIEEVIEPFLLQQGLINRTSRGRVATEMAVELLKATSLLEF